MKTRALIVALIGFASFLELSDNASAGVYTIHNCPASLQPNFSVGAIQAYGTPLASGSFEGTCTPGSALGTSAGWFGSRQTLNTNAGVTIKSPFAGTTIREIRAVWSVSHQSSGSDTFAQITSDSGVVDVYGTPFEASASSPTTQGFPAGTHEVNLYGYCSYDNSTDCFYPTATSPVMRLEGLDTTLEDTGLPAATINGGSLAGTNVAGEADLKFTAVDEESGVREAQLLVDGRTVDSTSYGPQCQYTTFAACPQSESSSMSWNTNSVSNGTHQMGLKVIDASGNAQTMDGHAIDVSNAPGRAGAETAPQVNACAQASGTHATITVAAKHHQITTRYGRSASLHGALNLSGKPVPAAKIEVLTRQSVSGASYTLVKTVETSARGTFKLVLSPGTSRSVCLRFQQESSGHYSAALNLSQRVQAGLRLVARPKTVESDGTVLLSGALHGGYIGEAGKVVELQVFYLGRWRVFETIRCESTGHFANPYTFNGGHGTFLFRARVRGESGYPYALGYSNVVRVNAD